MTALNNAIFELKADAVPAMGELEGVKFDLDMINAAEHYDRRAAACQKIADALDEFGINQDMQKHYRAEAKDLRAR